MNLEYYLNKIKIKYGDLFWKMLCSYYSFLETVDVSQAVIFFNNREITAKEIGDDFERIYCFFKQFSNLEEKLSRPCETCKHFKKDEGGEYCFKKDEDRYYHNREERYCKYNPAREKEEQKKWSNDYYEEKEDGRQNE